MAEVAGSNGNDGAVGVAAHIDNVMGFTIPARHARGRIVRLGPVLDAILAAHDYPPVIARLLAEALTLTALLGSTLKNKEGQMTIQTQTEGGVVDLLVCVYGAATTEIYALSLHDALPILPAQPSLFALFGKGYLAITFDQAVSGERYQGIVPLEGGSLAEAAESYFSQSEQIPSLVRLTTVSHGDAGHVSGGIMLQHLPEGEEGRERLHTRLDHPEWEHVRALAATIGPDELIDPALPLEGIAWRLFNEEDEVRVLPATAVSRGCRCNPRHMRDVIARFPATEQADMADGDGLIHVDCEFCSRRFSLALADIAA